MSFIQSNEFVHLHVHSHYSLLDGLIKMDQLAKKTHDLGMSAIAVTDHGNMFGMLDFQEQAQKTGIKPIFGTEFYVAPKNMATKTPKSKPFHLLAIAETLEGYHNLCKLSSESFIEGYYYKPRIDKTTLEQHSSGLIISSACLAGEVPRFIMNGDIVGAKKAAAEYRDIVGADNFFLELMDHGIRDQNIVNKGLIQISKEMNIPLIATNDIHFLNKEDKEQHDILLAIGTAAKISDENRFKMETDQFYLKSPDEMKKLFGEIPEALSNTVRISERCNVVIPTTETAKPDEKYKIPAFTTPNGQSESQYLEELCIIGLKKRYPEITPEIQERLDHELKVINDMGFPAYFLIVMDFIDYARNHDIPVGPGRGSAAGSLVSYALRITEIDPFRFNLFFERFLNPGRISMPDIDIDFCEKKREKVIEYVKEKYGPAQVAQIITYNYLKSKAVVKDVARVLELPFNTANEISNMIPQGSTLAEAFQEVEELRKKRAEGGIYETLFRNAFKLEGVIRHIGVHAAGVLISNQPLVNYVPLHKDKDSGNIVAQFDGPHLESCGLLKMDFLGLKNLTIIDECCKLIHYTKKIEIDFDAIGDKDPKTYELLQRGETFGVFQLESGGMQELLKKMQPDVFDDIVALLALYRPGPLNLGMDKQFVERKSGRKKIIYTFPELEPVLSDTYGILIYQEQVMKISQIIGGFTMSEADNLRRAMGKKKKKIINQMENKFMEGAAKGGFNKAKAAELYNQMAQFAEYGFNKSHSAAYAVLSYRTAYLKANYPLEYMAALLSGNKDKQDKVANYIKDAEDIGVKVLLPDINFSGINFSVDGENIRYGLSSIKGVGEAAANEIINSRTENPFIKSLLDFCKTVNMQIVNKRVIEKLISTGAFSSTGAKRSVMIAELESTMGKAGELQTDLAQGQSNFFDMFSDTENDNNQHIVNDFAEWSDDKIFAQELELLGAYVSGHPMDKYTETVRQVGTVSLDKIKAGSALGNVKVGGIIKTVDIRMTKEEKQWALITLEDKSTREVIPFFSKNFEKNRTELVVGNAIICSIIVRNDKYRGVSISGEKAQDINELKISKINIYMYEEKMTRESIKLLREELIDSSHKGESPLFFHIRDKHNKITTIKVSHIIEVNNSKNLLNFLNKLNFVEKVEIT